ncbi:MAG: TRAP transporter TatT component family protein [Pseudomonadota bacterium]
MNPWLRAAFLFSVALLLAACSPRQMVMGHLADGLASQGQQTEEDLDLAREASAFYLKLSESVLREQPGHAALAESVAAGFTQYAYAFVAFEADRVEGRDVAEAERLRQRAARLYRRAHRHGMTALEQAHPGLRGALAGDPAAWPKLDREEAGLAYWTAAAWGGWISLGKDNPELVADLPLAARLTRLAWQADPEWGQGSLTSLLATFEAARPGGDRKQVLAWFDQAITQANGKSAGPLLAKAEGHALPMGDRVLFETLLHSALAIPDAEDGNSLQNQVMQKRARWLLEQSPDLF